MPKQSLRKLLWHISRGPPPPVTIATQIPDGSRNQFTMCIHFLGFRDSASIVICGVGFAFAVFRLCFLVEFLDKLCGLIGHGYIKNEIDERGSESASAANAEQRDT